MTPEERFNQDVWWILQEIAELKRATLKGKPTEFEVVKLIAAGIPSQDRQKNIIHKLQEWKAVKIINESPADWGGSGRHIFKLQLLEPKFTEIYKKFQKACDLTSYLNDYQERMVRGEDPPDFLHLKSADDKGTAQASLREKHKGQMFETGSGGGFYNRNHPPLTRKKQSANEIVDGFSSSNYAFVLMVVKGILSASEFGINGEVNYRLQSAPGQMLMQERQLLSKFEKLGLFRNLGEDGIFGIATLSNVDLSLLRQIITEIEERESGVISENKFEEIKKRYAQTVQELRKSNQPSDLQERYNKVISEIRSDLKNLNVPLQADNQTPIYSPDDLNTDHNNGNQIKPTKFASAGGKLNKREIKKIISIAKKTCNLGIKEKSLLTILSDLEPYKTTDLTNQVPTKAYKKLKESLQKKIGHLGLHIDTIKGSGLNPTSYYQLKYLPQVAT